MSKRFDEMDEAEFDSLIADYIDRTANGYGEMPAAHFLDLLLERAIQKVEETIILSVGPDENGNLVITTDRETSDLFIHGNEIY